MPISEESNMSTTDRPEQPIRFAGSELCEKRHICGFFRIPEEEYQMLLPFIRSASTVVGRSTW